MPFAEKPRRVLSSVQTPRIIPDPSRTTPAARRPEFIINPDFRFGSSRRVLMILYRAHRTAYNPAASSPDYPGLAVTLTEPTADVLGDVPDGSTHPIFLRRLPWRMNARS
jgi:hypothetical protein